MTGQMRGQTLSSLIIGTLQICASQRNTIGGKRRRGIVKEGIGQLVLLLLAVAASIRLSAQPSVADDQQISAIIGRLVAHENPQLLLDPKVTGEKRFEELSHFRSYYTIGLWPESEAKVSGKTATVPARLDFKSSSGNSSEEIGHDVHLNFIKRDGQWYFADYDFLNLTAWEIIMFGAAIFLATAWMGGTVLKWRSLREHRTGPLRISELIADYFTAINPFTWFSRKNL